MSDETQSMSSPVAMSIRQRPIGELPLGAIIAVPLMLLPVGGWLVESQMMIIAQCSFKVMFGIPCMGCGGTRATLNLLHGHPLEALAFQPLAVLAYLGVGIWGILSLLMYVSGKTLHIESRPWLTWTVRGLLIAAPFANWWYLYAADI